MSENETGLDRLLTRHTIDVDINFTWDIRTEHRRFGRSQEFSESARLLNLSLEGALVEVALPSYRAAGDRIMIEMGSGRRGTVEIRHAHIAKSGDRMLYGVKFIESASLAPIINHIVADARGCNEQLLDAWEHAR